MAFPATYNFNYYRGDSFDFIINPKNPNGTSFDLDGFTSLFTIASSVTPQNVVVAELGDSLVNSQTATVACSITPEIGVSLSAGPYIYDVEVFNSETSVTHTLLRGTITVTQDVTR
jgi:hypothetical protein